MSQNLKPEPTECSLGELAVRLDSSAVDLPGEIRTQAMKTS